MISRHARSGSCLRYTQTGGYSLLARWLRPGSQVDRRSVFLRCTASMDGNGIGQQEVQRLGRFVGLLHREHQKGVLLRFIQSEDPFVPVKQQRQNFDSGRIPRPNPYRLRWRSEQEGQLPEVGVFGDDGETISAGIVPNLSVSRLIQLDVEDVSTVREQWSEFTTRFRERFWSSSNFMQVLRADAPVALQTKALLECAHR